jgi:penicillin-binding protein 1A
MGAAPHLAVQIRKWLIDWADRNDKDIYTDGLIVHTTLDSRLQAVANQAVQRQMDALQAVADVEWGMSSDRLLSTSVSAYVDQRRRVQPFSYYWKTHAALLDVFIRETPAYRSALEAGAKADAALAQLKGTKEFMAKLRADKTRLQAGFVAIDPATGHVKAWVGSRDFKTDQFDHVAQARRQPGSTFKPFVYGAALEQGMSAGSNASSIALWKFPAGRHGVAARDSIAADRPIDDGARGSHLFEKHHHRQVMQGIGPRKTAELARLMGVTQSKLDEVPALALGTSPVTPLEMVSAYSTLAAGGQYRAPIFITRITDKQGNRAGQLHHVKISA